MCLPAFLQIYLHQNNFKLANQSLEVGLSYNFEVSFIVEVICLELLERMPLGLLSWQLDCFPKVKMSVLFVENCCSTGACIVAVGWHGLHSQIQKDTQSLF